jgi:hypothetical protein
LTTPVLRLDYAATDIDSAVAHRGYRHPLPHLTVHLQRLDPQMLDGMIAGLSRLDLPGGGRAPLCVAGYATPENVIERVDPLFRRIASTLFPRESSSTGRDA